MLLYRYIVNISLYIMFLNKFFIIVSTHILYIISYVIYSFLLNDERERGLRYPHSALAWKDLSALLHERGWGARVRSYGPESNKKKEERWDIRTSDPRKAV